MAYGNQTQTNNCVDNNPPQKHLNSVGHCHVEVVRNGSLHKNNVSSIHHLTSSTPQSNGKGPLSNGSDS